MSKQFYWGIARQKNSPQKAHWPLRFHFRYEGTHRLERHKTYDHFGVRFSLNTEEWGCEIHNAGGYTHTAGVTRDKKLADAMAKMLIYLLENKLI